jgi:endonuclease V-like protein UPF0215 family
LIQINFAKDLRILGVDDGPFVRGVDKVCPIVGVLMRLDGKIENIAADSLSIDGGDVTGKISGLMDMLKIRPSVVMSEGITFAGFNILDPEEFYGRTGVPFLSVRKGKPDITAMIMAIRKYERDAFIKESTLRKINPDSMNLGGAEITANYAGMTHEDARKLLLRTLGDGILPEPVRLAHIVASTIYGYAHAIEKRDPDS